VRPPILFRRGAHGGFETRVEAPQHRLDRRFFRDSARRFERRPEDDPHPAVRPAFAERGEHRGTESQRHLRRAAWRGRWNAEERHEESVAARVLIAHDEDEVIGRECGADAS